MFHRNHLVMLLKWRFWLRKSGWNLRLCICNNHPGSAWSSGHAEKQTLSPHWEESVSAAPPQRNCAERMPRPLLSNWAGAGGKKGVMVRFYWIIKERFGKGRGKKSQATRPLIGPVRGWCRSSEPRSSPEPETQVEKVRRGAEGGRRAAGGVGVHILRGLQKLSNQHKYFNAVIDKNQN